MAPCSQVASPPVQASAATSQRVQLCVPSPLLFQSWPMPLSNFCCRPGRPFLPPRRPRPCLPARYAPRARFSPRTRRTSPGAYHRRRNSRANRGRPWPCIPRRRFRRWLHARRSPCRRCRALLCPYGRCPICRPPYACRRRSIATRNHGRLGQTRRTAFRTARIWGRSCRSPCRPDGRLGRGDRILFRTPRMWRRSCRSPRRRSSFHAHRRSGKNASRRRSSANRARKYSRLPAPPRPAAKSTRRPIPP